MINVNQITAQLARLPDQALQRYAMMHQDDPYVVSLALAESNRRKEIRGGAQMNAPQQPTVVEQAIQGMAPAPAPMAQPPMAQSPMPETVGIGQLPAGNMNFAGGGIVAFADGGETDDDYMYPPGESVARMAGGGAVPRYQYGGELSSAIMEAAETANPYVGRSIFERIVSAPDMTEDEKKRELARLLQQREAKTAIPTRATPISTDLGPVPGSDERSILGGVPTGTPSAPLPERRPPLPAVTGAGAAPAAGAAMPTTMGGVADLYKRMRDQFGGEDLPEGQRTQLEEINRIAEEQAASRRNRLELQQAARGLFGEEQEKRLKAREERINREEDNLFGTSLFQAGLAIMGGTSPHGMVNIAAGAQVGLKNYQVGMDKLSAARDKLDDAFGRLEEIRRNERRLDEKDLNAAEDDVQKTILQSKKEIYNATRENFKMNREDANKATDAYLRVAQSQFEQAEQTKRTNIMAEAQMRNDPLAMARALGEAKPGDPLLKGYGILKQEQQIPALYRAYIEASSDPMKGDEFRKRYPTFETYLSGMGGAMGGGMGGGFVAPPSNAPILRPPK